MTKIVAPEPERIVHDDHTVIVPPNTLKAKALSLTRQTPEEVARMINRADQALEALAPNFTEWMLSETKRLTDSYDAFEASGKDEEDVKSLFMVVHDIRGQALQFGYPIASQLAAGLCDLLQDGSTIDVPLVLLRRYVEAIGSIVRSGVRDEANAVALALARELAAVTGEFKLRSRQGASGRPATADAPAADPPAAKQAS
jgi:hypothetical protein